MKKKTKKVMKEYIPYGYVIIYDGKTGKWTMVSTADYPKTR